MVRLSYTQDAQQLKVKVLSHRPPEEPEDILGNDRLFLDKDLRAATQLRMDPDNTVTLCIPL